MSNYTPFRDFDTLVAIIDTLMNLSEKHQVLTT